jgi:hypothetical protein
LEQRSRPLRAQAGAEDIGSRNQSAPRAEKSFEQKEKKNRAETEKHEAEGEKEFLLCM